jgi:hypothetical protein
MTAARQRAAVPSISAKQRLFLLTAVLLLSSIHATTSATLAAAEAQQVRHTVQSSRCTHMTSDWRYAWKYAWRYACTPLYSLHKTRKLAL